MVTAGRGGSCRRGAEYVSRSSTLVLAVRVVLHCGQDHTQRKLLVAPVHAQPTLTSPLRCAHTVVFSHDANR